MIGLELDGDKYTLENGSVMSGEEILLRGLYELVSGDDQHVITEKMFGRDQSQQSRAFKFLSITFTLTFYFL